MSAGAPLLEVSRVSKRFGGVQAVREVSFRVERGTVKALIGPNGAGKTTLFNLLSGHQTPDAGEIRLRGQAIQGRPPHRIAALGLSRTFQSIKLFGHMTALENVMVGRHVRSRAGMLAGMLRLPATRREEREIERRALEALDLLGATELAPREAGSLSYGQQRAVELARALAAEPELLLLDEPAAGLNIRETAELTAQIGRIRDRGVTVLVVEHDMSLVMGISDEVVVLSYGEKIADADPPSVQRHPDVVRVYLGEEETC
ncbi:MAG TPA: ABC transporter ATP-binding protein [Anaeromyxobacteraceae bacterium]|nr:ABC transporter ATP-binding protein [Anaeromyxobacteraceae bacterium]